MQMPISLQQPIEIFTVKEAARFLRVSPWKIYDLAQSGSIPHIRVGRSLRFSRTQLEDWMRHGGSND